MRREIKINKSRRAATRQALLAGLPFLLVLGGCGATPAPEIPQSTASAPATANIAAPEATPARTPPPEATPPVQTAVVQPRPPVPATPINDDPGQLSGLDGRRVAALLGPAGYIRRDGPAEVWQYRAEQCVLDVYLYRDGGGLSVAHVDLRKRAAATEAPRRCFGRLIKNSR